MKRRSPRFAREWRARWGLCCGPESSRRGGPWLITSISRAPVSKLLPFFRWCDSTAVAETIRNSRVLFPLVESIHLLGLTVLLGTIIVLNLRLAGAGLR